MATGWMGRGKEGGEEGVGDGEGKRGDGERKRKIEGREGARGSLEGRDRRRLQRESAKERKIKEVD